MSEIKVTILLATYNRAHLIGETLDSILNQTYKNWECIIIDDNSTDNTEEYLKRNYLSKDKRFSYYKKDLARYSKGLGGSRNQSLDIAKEKHTTHINFFDDDDLMHSRKLELQVSDFENNENLSIVTCECEHLEVNDLNTLRSYPGGLTISSSDIAYDFISKNGIKINSCGPLWKAGLWSSERFNESLIIAEEFEVYSRVFLKNKIHIVGVPYILFLYRKHAKSNTDSRYSSINKFHAIEKADFEVFKTVCSIEIDNKTKLLDYFYNKYCIKMNSPYWNKAFLNNNSFTKKQLFISSLKSLFTKILLQLSS